MIIVLLSPPDIPLPPNANRLFALLLKCTFIDIKTGADVAADEVMDIPRHLVHHATIVPGRMGQNILQQLLIAVGHCFGHAIDVPFLGLHQAKQVLLRRRSDSMVARAKVCIERVSESLVPPAYLIERAIIANPILWDDPRRFYQRE